MNKQPTSYYTHEKCRGGCGKKVMNRSGFCRKCEPKHPCYYCKKPISSFSANDALCGVCKNIYKRGGSR